MGGGGAIVAEGRTQPEGYYVVRGAFVLDHQQILSVWLAIDRIDSLLVRIL